MNDVLIHMHHTLQVYEIPYVIGMKQGKYRKRNMHRCVYETLKRTET